MRRWGILIAAGVALAGCKNLDRDRAGRGDAGPASRTKPPAKPGKSWLDGPTPALDQVGTPPADSWADPKAPGFDTDREVRGVLAGFVEDPDGRKARDVFIKVEPADPAAAGGGAPVGVQTGRDGYFLIKGLKPKQTYVLTARTTADGREFGGRVYARTATDRSQFIRIALLEGLALGGPPARERSGPAGTDPKAKDPPPAAIPPPVIPSGGSSPRPDPVLQNRDTGAALPPPLPADAPADGAWSPTSPATRPAPPTLPPAVYPPPRPPARPDLIADGPDGGWRPPATSIPPPAPPTVAPPPPGRPNRTQSKSVRQAAGFTLVDTLGEPRSFPSGQAGDLILLDFMTTGCLPCKKAIPTLRGLQEKYGTRGLEVVGVACDDADPASRRAVASRYQREYGLNYLLYVEPGADPGLIQKRFGVRAYPTLVLLDGAGEVLWTGHPREAADLERVIGDHLGRR